jgi:hypothetical protein
MQGAFVAARENHAESIYLESLLKRIVSGELAFPCCAHDLSLTSKVDFGAIDPDLLSSEVHQRPVHLFNSSPHPITVARIDLLPEAEFFGLFSDASLLLPVKLPAIILAGSALSFVVCLRAASYPGKLCCRMVVSASTGPEQARPPFIIGCMCTAVIRNPNVNAVADVEAKAFVPAAIRSIFDHRTFSYSTALPPECGTCLKLVCCFCRGQSSKSSQSSSGGPTAPDASEQSHTGSAEALLQPSDFLRHIPPHPHQPQQSGLSGETNRFVRHCQCGFHLSCIQRWASILREDFPIMLPCPACGLVMTQLQVIISTLPRGVSYLNHLSSQSIPDTGLQFARREHFVRHLVNLIEASKAEFFARLEELRGFAAFDVEFREIETSFPASAATASERTFQALDAALDKMDLGHLQPDATTPSQSTPAQSFEPRLVLLSLKLPGVPENSPKVHLYQNMRLRFSRRALPEPPATVCGAEFVCHVVKVRGSEVVVACNSSMATVLQHHRAEPLNLHVCFCMDVFAISQDFRMLLFGLDMRLIPPLLFPHLSEVKPLTPAPAAAIFDPRLSAAQLQGVACALQSVARDDDTTSPAHVVCGPPGTGKTSVLAEIILQLWQLHQQEGSSGCILVTAPSPDAADVLALRLREHLSPDDLLLVCSTRRSVDTLRPGLRPYTNISTTESHGIPVDVFVLPSIHFIRSRGVIVASCSACSELSDVLADAGSHAGFHVRLVVVDEAAQATEVDALKALAFVGRRTRVLLAGDQMQLGPVVISRRALELQFQVSLMQRLVALDAYRQPGMCSPLTVNYRSHPALIAVPSYLFYQNAIRCAQFAPSEAPDPGPLLGQWQGLPRRDFPLMFYGVAGVDSSPDGHGVRNSAEAKSLLFLVSKLLEDMPWLSQSDIGVMAPFRLQVALSTLCFC